MFAFPRLPERPRPRSQPGHGLPFDNRLAGAGVDDARQGDWSMADGCDDSSSLPDVFGDCVKPPGGRIVIERGVTGGTKKSPWSSAMRSAAFAPFVGACVAVSSRR